MEIKERQEVINWFGGLESVSLLHISDVHLWYSTRILNRLEAIIKRQNPDLILLTGDYYDLPKGAQNFRNFLFKIGQHYTVVFIKGNHDSLFGTKIFNLLSGIPGCTAVEDVVFKYTSEKGKVYNITSWQNKHCLPQGNDEKNIVLLHNPEKIKTAELSNIQLILAGHLHGGQFIFFKTKKNSNFPGCLLYKHCTDRKQLKNTTLIVSRGLGDTFPFRFNCPKEVVRISIE